MSSKSEWKKSFVIITRMLNSWVALPPTFTKKKNFINREIIDLQNKLKLPWELAKYDAVLFNAIFYFILWIFDLELVQSLTGYVLLNFFVCICQTLNPEIGTLNSVQELEGHMNALTVITENHHGLALSFLARVSDVKLGLKFQLASDGF